MVKALALCSGGLDSLLAAKIILNQGVQVEAVYFVNAFMPGYNSQRQEGLPLLQKRSALLPKNRLSQPTPQPISKAYNSTRRIGIQLHILDISQPHLALVQSPRYGYGKNMNPCIDCRIFMLKQAKAYMQRQDFSFLVSGEVLGQRPMSQRRDSLNIVDREAQAKGLILRPLSAKLLRPTLAEEKGWVNREKLLAFSGRSRKPQLALAEKLGIKEYLTPAGGCLLTEEGFVRKFRDLIAAGEFNLDDVYLLKLGRHFRYKSRAKIIMGRNEEENTALLDLTRDDDVILKIRDFAGPLTIIRPADTFLPNGLIESAAKLTARYSKGRDSKKRIWVDYWSKNLGQKKSILTTPAEEELVAQMRI